MERAPTISSDLHEDFYTVKTLVYDKCDFDISAVRPEKESKEYGACNFQLNGKKIKFRVAKTTPTKSGQFVAIWKRNECGVTRPFDIGDDLDFIVITARSQSHFGKFIFPKSALADQNIMSKNNKGGKRGIRVYAPWDIAGSTQARRTQAWQQRYFLPVTPEQSPDLQLTKKLFGITDT